MANMYYNPDNGEQPNWFWLAFLLTMLVVASLCLSSCGSSKVITKTEYVTTTDTLIVNHTDTVIITNISEVVTHDTIISEREIERIISVNGDTIKEREKTNTYHGHSNAQKDSTSHYKALYEQLLNKQSNNVQKTENKQSKQAVLTIPTGFWMFAFIAFVALVIALMAHELITKK